MARSDVETMKPVLEIRNLSAVSAAGPILRNISLTVNQAEAMALVGESNSESESPH